MRSLECDIVNSNMLQNFAIYLFIYYFFSFIGVPCITVHGDTLLCKLSCNSSVLTFMAILFFFFFLFMISVLCSGMNDIHCTSSVNLIYIVD